MMPLASHFGIRHLSPVPEHSGAGIGPFIPALDRFQHWHYILFLYRSDKNAEMPDFGIPAF
jgi:hypothetical protein